MQTYNRINSFSLSLTSILISRFILDLRNIDLSGIDNSTTQSRFSSVYFASNVVGNLGASLGADMIEPNEGLNDTGEIDEYVDFSDTEIATKIDMECAR